MKFLLNLKDILNQLVIIIYLIYNLTYLVKEIIYLLHIWINYINFKLIFMVLNKS